MSLEFIDTNILVYAYSQDSAVKREASDQLIDRLLRDRTAAISVQVLCEFYGVAMRKLHMTSTQVEGLIANLASVALHHPTYADVIPAIHLHRRYPTSWWDALILNSALELGCHVLWTEDFRHGQRIGALTVRNPFR